MYVKVRKHSRPFWNQKIRKDGAVLLVPDKPFKDKPAKWMIPCDVNGLTTDEAELALERREAQDEQDRINENVENALKLEMRAEIMAEIDAEKANKQSEKKTETRKTSVI